jgi:hypothetical protein
MNDGLTEIVEEIQTKFRRPPQVKSSKAQIHAKFHKIPAICFRCKLGSYQGRTPPTKAWVKKQGRFQALKCSYYRRKDAFRGKGSSMQVQWLTFS